MRSRPVPEDAEQPLIDLQETYRSLSSKNLLESFHDAQQALDSALNLFSLGYLPLAQRSQAETLYWAICRRMHRMAKELDYFPEELEGLDGMLSDTYFCNFSLFQSMPDSWAVKQLFPIMPIHRLNEMPTRSGVLGDISCDSDGKIDQFIDRRDVKRTLPLHPFNGEPYLMGAFLVGAYQEILGDLHNLFGDTNAVHVSLGPERRRDSGRRDSRRHRARGAGLRPVQLQDAARRVPARRRDRAARRAASATKSPAACSNSTKRASTATRTSSSKLARQRHDNLRVILVAPRNPLNIGAAARAMSNFGFRRLRLVNPYQVAFQEARSAVHAHQILREAEEFPTLAEAIADCSLVVGTTSLGHRELQHPLRSLEYGGRLDPQAPGRGARRAAVRLREIRLVERRLSYCHWLVRIGTEGSMNLGQAVAVCLYELVRNACRRLSPTSANRPRPRSWIV